MHSSETLSGASFAVTLDGAQLPHAACFDWVTKTTRLGIVARDGLDAVGAATFISACVTAFYDAYRREAGSFFAYPDFFVFQQQPPPLADYAMLDVWPQHKMVAAPGTSGALLQAINDRAVDCLLVPDGPVAGHDLEPVAVASAERTVTRCYAYSREGQAHDADLVVTCLVAELRDWVATVFSSTGSRAGDSWLARHGEVITQSFRRLDLADALARI